QVLRVEPAPRPGFRGRIPQDKTGAVKTEVIFDGWGLARKDAAHGVNDLRVAAKHGEHPGQVIAVYPHFAPCRCLEFGKRKPIARQGVESPSHEIRVAAHKAVKTVQLFDAAERR